MNAPAVEDRQNQWQAVHHLYWPGLLTECGAAGVLCAGTKILFNAQELVVLRDAIRAAGGAGLDLSRSCGDRQIGDGRILRLAGPVRHNLLAGIELGRQATDNLRNTGYFNNTATTLPVLLSDPLIDTPVIFDAGMRPTSSL